LLVIDLNRKTRIDDYRHPGVAEQQGSGNAVHAILNKEPTGTINDHTDWREADACAHQGGDLTDFLLRRTTDWSALIGAAPSLAGSYVSLSAT
jgi:hypothetical protein